MRGKWMSGSMTIEASIVLPIMFFVVAAFLKMFLILHTQLDMQITLQSCLNRYCCLSLITEECGERITETEVFQRINEQWSEYVISDDSLGKVLNNTGEAVALREWILLQCSEMLIKQNIALEGQGLAVTVSDEEYAGHAYKKVNMHYVMNLLVIPGYTWAPYVKQSANCSGWQGRSYHYYMQDETERYVYYTEHGGVYHTSLSCKYLNIAIYQVPAEDISELRNLSGGKYYPCEHCIEEDENITCYYVTAYGTAYHRTVSCGAISRNVNRVLESDISMPQCSVCRMEEAHL